MSSVPFRASGAGGRPGRRQGRRDWGAERVQDPPPTTLSRGCVQVAPDPPPLAGRRSDWTPPPEWIQRNDDVCGQWHVTRRLGLPKHPGGAAAPRGLVVARYSPPQSKSEPSHPDRPRCRPTNRHSVDLATKDGLPTASSWGASDLQSPRLIFGHTSVRRGTASCPTPAARCRRR